MARFAVPAQPSRSVLCVDRLLGVDMTNDPGNVAKEQSPCGDNMIRDVPGKVRKCMGYQRIATLSGAVHGCHFFKNEALVHAGESLFCTSRDWKAEPRKVYEGMADAASRSWLLNGRLFIADGKELLVYDGETVQPAANLAKVPLFTIARPPAGGGVQYEPLNLLQPRFTERFAGTEADTVYALSFSGLDETPVTVRLLEKTGEWQEMAEGEDFTVDREAGQITFETAPGKSPVTGEDNVEITAARTVTGYADRVNKCDVGALFGVGGAADRLFLAGNPDLPNYDWFSGQNDAAYWPDTGYSVLGSGAGAVMGYSVIDNYLAAHKDAGETERNVILRRGDLVDDEPAFPIVNTLQGPGAAAKGSFAYLASEPVFLTALGIYAITPSDISGERYSQNRSYYLNGALTRETGLAAATAAVHRDLYWLCLGGKAYILDGMQDLGLRSGEPYSTRQYACFYRTDLPAVSIWSDGDDLFFGDGKGGVFRFYSDPTLPESYNDDGAAIRAVWETPDLGGKLFYKNKNFCRFAVQLTPAAATSVSVWAQKRGSWRLVGREERRARYLSYRRWCYSKFTYSNDSTTKTLHGKLRIKRVDKARFRFENTELNEPFGLMAWALEFSESGNYKG